MSVVPEYWPRDLLTLADWDALPEDSSRHYELVDGVIVVNARPTPRHQRVARRLASALEAPLPATWEALLEVEILIDAAGPATVRAPDIVLMRADAVDDRPRVDPASVLAVAEILSPGTRRVDRVAKVADYAEAGIECYLLVEPADAAQRSSTVGPGDAAQRSSTVGPCPSTVLTELRLRDGAYERVAEHRDAATITLDGVDVVIDLAGMLNP